MCSRGIVKILVIASVFWTHPVLVATSHAAGISIGLDRDTRDTINNLPENIRKQLFLLIQQSLPLIDTSINWYITHIDLVLKDSVSQVIDHMSCNLHGVLENYKDSIGASLASLFIKSDNSGKLVPINIPATISALEKAINDTRSMCIQTQQAEKFDWDTLTFFIMLQ